ncbi:MAG: hypothetical protein HY313_03585 [Acidobacteria bacterium]|nr:hypothetical protein [Acidobacteriota bacterium]
MKNALRIPYAFVLMNWAAVVSLYYFLRRGNDIGQDIWTMPFHTHTHSEPPQGEDKPLWTAVRQLN